MVSDEGVSVVTGFFRSPCAGDCYRAKRDDPNSSDRYKSGDLAVVTEIRSDGRVVWTTRGLIEERSHRISDPEEFVRHWDFVPDAENVINSEVAEVMKSISEVETLSLGARAEVALMAPHVVMPESGPSEEALAPMVADIAVMRGKLASTRNDVAKMSVDLKRRQSVLKGYLALQRERVEAILKAQMDALSAKVGDLNALMARAEEAIWTINLYLGKDEQIVQIKKGKPSPKDTKISIRQRVLFADEECAVSAEEGGIDHMSIEAFDEWLKVPANRRQVLPEDKGVVAFKPRRRKKDYGGSNDPSSLWAQAAHDKANKKTYFFMANGENLYRICTELEVAETLIPTEGEFSDLFFTYRHDAKLGGTQKEPIYPGDDKYMAAMEASSDLRKHYLRILLFLQGLVDRTTVFAPLPAPRLNLLNRRVHDDFFNFVTDAEKLLSHGRPSFDDWLEAINKRLDVGHRIMGAFGSWSNGLRHYKLERGGNERLSPPGAAFPSDLTLYTIEGSEDGKWFFRYERIGETIWRKSTRWNRQESGEAKRRASCRVSVSDTFILNFDDASIDDMNFYLQDRVNRQGYAEMFPLLKKAIEIKEKEAEEEAPFRDLISRELKKRYGSSTVEEVSSLVSWWKLKNKTHRALLSDDSKALRMILRESGRRRVHEEEYNEVEAGRFVSSVRGLDVLGDLLLVAYNRDGLYVTLSASDGGNVFVDEREWNWDGETANLLSTERARTVERKRLLSWKIVCDSERWKAWQVDARDSDHLTLEETMDLVAAVRGQVIKKVAEREDWNHGDKPVKPDAKGILCIQVSPRTDEHPRERLLFWVWRQVGRVPSKVLTGEWREPSVERVEVSWSKKKGIIEPAIGYSNSTYTPNNREKGPFHPWGRWGKGELVETDEALVREFEENVSVYSKAAEVLDRYASIQSVVVSSAQEAMKEIILAKKKTEFLAEYEHEELWEEHLKTLREENAPRSQSLAAMVVFTIEHHVVASNGSVSMEELLGLFEGRKFRDVVADAKGLGWKPGSVKRKRRFHEPEQDEDDQDEIPLDAEVTIVDWQRNSILGKAKYRRR